MKFTTAAAATALTASAGVLAQSLPAGLPTSLPSNINISSSCQQAAIGLISSPLVQCLQISALFPLFTQTNTSIIPVLDNWMSRICSSAPCNQTAFNAAASAISTGCASDLAWFGINGTQANTTLIEAFKLYPIARELVCLRTTEPGAIGDLIGAAGTLANSSTPLNSTNGTFCVSNLLTQAQNIAGFNLTTSKLINIGMQAYKGNLTALTNTNITSQSPELLCQDCIFAGADIIGQAYPQIWNLTVAGNTTIGGFLNDTCSADGFNVTYNGTLPDSIILPSVGDVYPFNLNAGNQTYTPGPNAVAPPALFNSTMRSFLFPSPAVAGIAFSARSVAASATAAKRDVTAAKRRWVGA